MIGWWSRDGRRREMADARFARSVESLVKRQHRLIGAANLAARFGADRLVLLCAPTGSGITVLMDTDGVLTELGESAPRLAQFVQRCADGLLEPGEVFSVEPMIGVSDSH
jgi:hypothetical protein